MDGSQISVNRILFFLAGIFISACIFYPKVKDSFLESELLRRDYLKFQPTLPAQMPTLNRELLTGLICITSINFLLLINNVIDIDWIWLGFEPSDSFNLTQFVHEGTYLLILSILLSMGIMLYLFRGPQHFNPQNTWLKRLSFIWILQNIFLVASVGMRNYHYIDAQGLAYKRIGVIFFLGLTLYGLWTLFRKIQVRHSLFYLLKANSWAVFVMMISLCMINWDVYIADHNLTERKGVDAAYLLSLSDKAIPELWNQRDQFSPVDKVRGSRLTETQLLQLKIDRFYERQGTYSWFSWNLPDQRTHTYLANRPEAQKKSAR